MERHNEQRHPGKAWIMLQFFCHTSSECQPFQLIQVALKFFPLTTYTSDSYNMIHEHKKQFDQEIKILFEISQCASNQTSKLCCSHGIALRPYPGGLASELSLCIVLPWFPHNLKSYIEDKGGRKGLGEVKYLFRCSQATKTKKTLTLVCREAAMARRPSSSHPDCHWDPTIALPKYRPPGLEA